MYELNRLLKKHIQDAINNKITGKCNVTIIENTLIVEIVPKHISESIFRQTFISHSSFFQSVFVVPKKETTDHNWVVSYIFRSPFFSMLAITSRAARTSL